VYLLDTGIILELLLDQEKADDVEQLLRETQSGRLHLTEFTLYSLGIILTRRKLQDTFFRRSTSCWVLALCDWYGC
jgi:predicted nucleic acid-binding protein